MTKSHFGEHVAVSFNAGRYKVLTSGENFYLVLGKG